jgi:diguanylate cyclase (GGDEF)-like protein
MSSSAHKNPSAIDLLAEEFGVAVVVLDEKNAEIAASNNNSICEAMTASSEFAPRCAEFCGRAFERTHASGEAFDYECHAGLSCRAVATDDNESRTVTIVGRAFVRSDGYRLATEKAIAGEWASFSPAELFQNVLMTGSTEPIEKAADRILRTVPAAKDTVLDLGSETTKKPETDQGDVIAKLASEMNEAASVVNSSEHPRRGNTATASAAALRSLSNRLMESDYREACRIVLDHIHEENKIGSLVWLEQYGDGFRSVASLGEFAARAINVKIRRDSGRLLQAADRGDAIELKERSAADGPASRLMLFPVKVGNEVRAAVGVNAGDTDLQALSAIGRLAKSIGPQIEILRLRDEVTRSEAISEGVRKLGNSLKKIDNDDFWTQITRISAELLNSERASLLVRDENSGKLTVRASIGSAVDLQRTSNVGARIANQTFERGESLVVSDIDAAGIGRAPSDWKYKTSSFISYPITIGDRRLAVMNFTDRADGGSFVERDLEVLNTIAPQIAVALDRGKLQVRAGELEKRSITDSLTGLMNRGYIEERLIEEMNRASRYRFPMSLLMIDVDHFKSYNDSYGHPAGDVALRLVAGVLKRTLRAADVAARYGGEEFAVLLPQTPVEQASWIAERIRQRVERTEFPKRQVTISLGVAGFSNEFDEPKDWITAADMALYEAKEHGRNQVIRYEDMGRSFREKIN